MLTTRKQVSQYVYNIVIIFVLCNKFCNKLISYSSVVNLGDDTDTVGAIYGQIAGCYYGYDGIPPEWREKCFFTSLLTLMADEIHDLSLKIVPPPLPIPDDEEWMKNVKPVDEGESWVSRCVV